MQEPSEILVNVIVISDVTEDSVIVAVPPTNITVFEPDPVLYVTTASVSPVMVKTASSPEQIGPFALTDGTGTFPPPIIISCVTNI